MMNKKQNLVLKNLLIKEEFLNQFASDFILTYFANGLGSMSKKEIDLYVFTWLYKSKIIQVTDGFQKASVTLKIPVSKVRSLYYEMQLREGYAENNEWFKEELLKAVQHTKFKRINSTQDRIEFGVENPLLKAEIEGHLKKNGRFAEYGISREILQLSIEDFAYLLELVLSREEKIAIIKPFNPTKKLTDQNEKSLFSEAIKTYVLAFSKSAGTESSRIVVEIAFKFLSGGIAAITSALSSISI